MQSTHVADSEVLRSPASASSGRTRLALGFLQGLSLYVLHITWSAKSWPTTGLSLYVALCVVAATVPLAAIVSLSHLPRRVLCVWLSLLAIVLFAAGFYDGWRLDLSSLLSPSLLDESRRALPSGTLSMLTACGLFIAQALVLAANVDGKRIASYRSYFDTAWKLLVQILFAMLFSGLFWLVLQTGSILFALIKLDFLRRLIEQSWFSIPVTTVTFAFGLHMGDMRPHLIDGIRKLLLSLLSWLLPVAVLIIGGFLLSIPATGLEPLWQTRRASYGLLGAAVLLVVLINTVYQDGLRPKRETGRFFRLCMRIACLMPVLLILLATYSLGLRVAEYGWTVSRVSGATCTLIAAVYAFGYAYAAIRLRDHLRYIAVTNVFAAFVVLLVFLALLTPVANPARIAVASQLARLESGNIPPARFDFRFLRFNGDRYGVAELKRLSQLQTGTQAALIRQHATQALATVHPWDHATETASLADLTKNIRMFPVGRRLPSGFSGQDWRNESNHWLPSCLKIDGYRCDAYAVTPDPRGKEQLLIFDSSNFPALFAPNASGQWQLIGTFSLSPACKTQLKQTAERGALRWQLPEHRDLELNGQRIRMQPEQKGITCSDPVAPK